MIIVNKRQEESRTRKKRGICNKEEQTGRTSNYQGEKEGSFSTYAHKRRAMYSNKNFDYVARVYYGSLDTDNEEDFPLPYKRPLFPFPKILKGPQEHCTTTRTPMTLITKKILLTERGNLIKNLCQAIAQLPTRRGSLVKKQCQASL